MLCRGWEGSAATAEVEGVDDHGWGVHVEVGWILSMMCGRPTMENQFSGLVHHGGQLKLWLRSVGFGAYLGLHEGLLWTIDT